MKVLIVNQDMHGLIGIVRCEGNQVKWAVDYLIETKWITHLTDIWLDNSENQGDWVTVAEAYGEDWANVIRSWTIDQFNEIWEGCFSLSVQEIYGVNNATIW